ncbi:MAG: hypothetical protein ACI9C4_000888 [Paraglaciecola sp.]|jgi:hypothetical protein
MMSCGQKKPVSKIKCSAGFISVDILIPARYKAILIYKHIIKSLRSFC